MSEHCPMCGTPVEIVSSDEGTHHMRPTITEEMVRRARRALNEDVPAYVLERAAVGQPVDEEQIVRTVLAAALSTKEVRG